MTSPSSSSPSTTPPLPSGPAAPGRAAGSPAPGGVSAADTGVALEGSTEVLPAVVAKVATFAAREIPGVVSLGGATSRAVGAVRQTLTGNSENTAGVGVELEGETARLALDVAIEYGVGARELTRALRRHVPQAVSDIAGITVTGLDIRITDVRLPGETEA